MQLSEIVYYPVKSMRGLNADSAPIRPEGLPHDRGWLLTTADGRFMSARKLPQLLLWQAEPTADGLKLTAPDGDSRTVLLADYRHHSEVSVWHDTFSAHSSHTAETDRWLSQKLATDCRLHHLGTPNRLLDYSQTAYSFADGAPYLLANSASLAALNAKLDEPVEMRRFRANLIIDTDTAWAELEWRIIRIGEVEFELFKPCLRCVMTTVDLSNGSKHPAQQPLKTLARDHQAVFGVNMIARNSGRVALGDPVTLIR